MCLEKGVHLFQIYEDDWDNRKDIVKSMIINKIGLTNNKIFARKCEVREISDNNLIKNFLENNHLQGYTSSTTKLGLYYENEMVSIILFKKDINGTFNLNRFCNKINFCVIGGFSKLLKFFIKNFSPEGIITFSNNDYSDGRLYEINGFTKAYDLRPDYSYNINGLRKHKFNYRKNKLFKIFENVNLNDSEHKIMIDNNIYRIYDSGKIKWILNI